MCVKNYEGSSINESKSRQIKETVRKVFKKKKKLFFYEKNRDNLFEYIALIHGVKPNNTQNLQDNLVE
jgi:hypothetical protein